MALEKYALEEVPLEDRQPWFSLAFIWIGVIICIPALMSGGALITGLTFAQAFLATAIGFTIVVMYMIFQAMQGSDLGRPTVANAGSAFGDLGARILISIILGIGCLGWFGVLTNVCGVAFSSIMGTWLDVTIPVWLSSLIWGIIMLATAVIGFNGLKYLNYIAVPILLVLTLYGTYTTVTKFGLEMVFAYQPPNTFTFFHGIAIAVGGFAVGGVIAADVSRYARGRREAVLSIVLGVWPAGLAMFLMGGIMAVVAGSYDITMILTKLGMPGIGLIILIYATWTTSTVNAYSGGLAITKLFGLDDSKRALATGIAGGLGTLLAVTGIINYFIEYLIFLSSAIPPIAGVMIADYWILRKGKAAAWNPNSGVDWRGVISWATGVCISIVIKVGIIPINGLLAALFCYLILSAGAKKINLKA